jgi:Protein of unknown function DUF262
MHMSEAGLKDDGAPEPKLLQGEELDFSEVLRATPSTATDSELNEKYVAGEVRIVTEQARYPLNTIVSLLESGDYELNPEFQRRHRWSSEKQSRLIESFVMNVPVPPIFLYEDRYSHYEVMDGLQRLSAIASFYRDQLTLEGLTVWPELNGRNYSNLPEQVKRGVDRRYLSSIILLHETAKTEFEAQKLKQLVFERINSGGVRLEAQESRNAIYDGPLNRLCLRLSRNVFLCRTWDIPEPTEEELRMGVTPPELDENPDYSKMKDVELVLRFFAHRQRRRIGTGALEAYLDFYLKQGNLFPERVLDGLAKLFEDTIQLVWEVLGERAFWLWRFRHGQWNWLQRPTTTAYDAFMFVFSQNLHRREALLARRENFQRSMPKFYEAKVAAFDARTTNMRNLRERDSLVTQLVSDVLNGPAD